MITTRIDALDFLAQLGDEAVFDYTATDKTITEIVTALLAFQLHVVPITLGTIEPVVTRSIEVQQDTILGVIQGLRDTVGGYIYVDNDRKLNWLNDIGEDKGQQIRYKKNIKGIARELEYTNFGNRLYCYGAGEGTARIHLSQAIGMTEDYVEDAGPGSSQATYGICIRQLTDKSITDPNVLLAWALLQLVEMKYPRATYRVDAINLAAMGWSFEVLQLGSVVKVIDEDLGMDVSARIKKIIRDLTNPENITLEISNVVKDIIDTMGKVYDTLQFERHLATKFGAGQVIVLGAFTVADWVTGGTTNIKGDYVRTGHLESTNWGVGAGSQFDLDAGTFKLGGSAAPKLSWDGVTLIVTGAIYATSGEFTGILKTTTLQAATILTISGTISAGAGAILINTTGFHVACSGITDTWFHIYNGVDDSYIRQQSGILPSLQITSERKIVIQPSGSGLDGNIYLITSGSHSILPSASGEIYLGSATVHFNTIYAHTFAIVSPMKMKFTNAVDSIKAIKTKNIDGIEKLDKDTLPPNIVTKVTKKELEEYDLYFDSLMKYYEGEKTLGHNVEKPVKHDLEDSSVSLNDLIGLLFTGQQEIIKRVEKLEVK